MHEEQLEREAVALSLPWPVHRPSASAIDEMLTISAPAAVDEHTAADPLRVGPSPIPLLDAASWGASVAAAAMCSVAGESEAADAQAPAHKRDASGAPGDERPRKKSKVDLRVGRVVWLLEPPADAPPMPMVILRKVDGTPGAGGGLVQGPLTTPPDHVAPPGTPVPRTAVVEFGYLLPAVWQEHGDAPGVHTAVQAAMKQMHAVGGSAREPRGYWQKFVPGVPYPFH